MPIRAREGESLRPPAPSPQASFRAQSPEQPGSPPIAPPTRERSPPRKTNAQSQLPGDPRWLGSPHLGGPEEGSSHRCPWARHQVALRKEQPHLHSPFPGAGEGWGGGEAPACPRGACSLPEPAHPSGKRSDSPKTRNASQPASASLPISPSAEAKPNKARRTSASVPRGVLPRAPRTERFSECPAFWCSDARVGLWVLVPVRSLFSCATLAKHHPPSSLQETQSRDITPDLAATSLRMGN